VRAVPSAAVTSSRVIALRARDLIFNPQTARLYLSMPGGTEAHSNSVVALDPSTGSITGSVFVGSEPGRLARSDNGQYLYVGLNGASAVRRVEMASLTPGLQWSLPSGQVAGDLEVAPGQPNTVAVSRHRPGISPPLDGVTIYDAGVARPNSSPGHTGGARIEFLESPSVLYGFNNSHTGFEFFTIAVEPSGARHIAETRGLISGFYTNIAGAAGRIYGTDGSVVDAERRVRVGTLGAGGSALLPDPATGRVFMIAEGGIRVYDMNNYQLLGTIPISGFSFDHPALANTRLVRWGNDGLAFLDQDELFLIRSPIVAP
jgi:DNA-binding beta-propeller fold protein YncE